MPPAPCSRCCTRPSPGNRCAERVERRTCPPLRTLVDQDPLSGSDVGIAQEVRSQEATVGMAAASSSVRLTGRVASSPSRQHTCCAYVPKERRLKPNTRSPTANDRTSGPAASTSPENTMAEYRLPWRVPAQYGPRHEPVHRSHSQPRTDQSLDVTAEPESVYALRSSGAPESRVPRAGEPPGDRSAVQTTARTVSPFSLRTAIRQLRSASTIPSRCLGGPVRTFPRAARAADSALIGSDFPAARHALRSLDVLAR